jgi:hypothetical protein
MPFILSRHPSTPCAAVRHFQAEAWASGAELRLRYALEADIAALCLPTPGLPRRADGLWRHTCFEAFLKRPEAAGYQEFNFSPSGDWAAYRFEAYREGMALADVDAPSCVWRIGPQGLELEVRIKPGGLAEDSRLGLSAVIEAKNGGLSYWALAHPPGKPDFHHPGSFVCQPEPI